MKIKLKRYGVTKHGDIHLIPRTTQAEPGRSLWSSRPAWTIYSKFQASQRHVFCGFFKKIVALLIF